jgi:serine-type D-Ala-D-Ala carboxypeptidase/endopeptidase (penicillin-binding protein 4)
MSARLHSSCLVRAPNGVIFGDLVVRAGGDPTLTTASLGTLADTVAKTGVKTVTGDLVVDESHFDSARGNLSWKPQFSPGEVGSLSAFVVNGNHTRGASQAEPALANLVMFRNALKSRGVVVVGRERKGTLPDGGPILAKLSSAPLSEILAHMLKESDNTYAETMLKELGARGGDGSTLGGVNAVRKQFDRFGIAPPTMVDGSGLSSLNRSSARQQVLWLQKVRSSSIGSVLMNAMPISCVDGTLKRRLCGTTGASKVMAKTGTLDSITGLSGYTTTAMGKNVTFAFLASSTSRSTVAARAAIDKALVAITSAQV